MAKPVGAAAAARALSTSLRMASRPLMVCSVPAQRQHIAPIAVGMEQVFQRAVIGFRRARSRTPPASLSAATAISSVLSSMRASRPPAVCAAFPLDASLYPFGRPQKGARRQRLFARETGCAPDPAEHGRSAYRDRPAAPRRARGSRSRSAIRSRLGAKPDHAAPKRCIDAARAPFLGALADLVGREEPARLGAGQFRLRRATSARWVSPTRPEYFIWSPKCRCSVSRSGLLPAMST